MTIYPPLYISYDEDEEKYTITDCKCCGDYEVMLSTKFLQEYERITGDYASLQMKLEKIYEDRKN